MITEIERFQAVVRIGSITKTSKKLGITQPALSQTIKRLQKNLGYNLFSHRQKGLTLTSKGEKFYRMSIKIIDLWKKGIDIKNDFNETISIGLFDNAALRLAKFIGNWVKNLKNPVEIKIDKSKILLQDLRYGLIDLVVSVIDPNFDLGKDVLLIKMLEEELLPVASKRFELPLDKIPFILYNNLSTTRSYIDSNFMKNGIVPVIAAQSTSPSFMKELALSGTGVALLPKNLVDGEKNRGSLILQKMPLKFSRKIGVFIRQENEQNIEFQKLSNMIISQLALAE